MHFLFFLFTWFSFGFLSLLVCLFLLFVCSFSLPCFLFCVLSPFTLPFPLRFFLGCHRCAFCFPISCLSFPRPLPVLPSFSFCSSLFRSLSFSRLSSPTTYLASLFSYPFTSSVSFVGCFFLPCHFSLLIAFSVMVCVHSLKQKKSDFWTLF